VSHRLGRHREEVRAVLPLFFRLIDQAQVGFVDERSGLQRVAAVLAGHIATGHPVQFRVNQRHQFFWRGLIALAPFTQ
jgi:hypothetical protein